VTVDLDSIVELDGSEAVRKRLTPASTSTHVAAFDERLTAQRRFKSNVEDGLNVVRRRQGQRLESTMRSTSTVTTARLAASSPLRPCRGPHAHVTSRMCGE